MTVRIRFQPGLRPKIEKHGEHDQSSHGSWAHGGLSSKEKEIHQRITNVKRTSWENYDKYAEEDDKRKVQYIEAEYTTKDNKKYILNQENIKEPDDRFNPKVFHSIEVIAYEKVQGGLKEVGRLNTEGGNSGIIEGVLVKPEYQRQGIATAMLNMARTYAPDNFKIEHSFSLTEDAKNWSSIVKHQSGQHDQESHGNWAGYPGELEDKIWEEYQSERKKLYEKKIKAGIPEKIAHWNMGEQDNPYYQENMKEAGVSLTPKQIKEFSAEEQRIEGLLNKRNKISQQWYDDHFVNNNNTPDKFLSMSEEIEDIRNEYVVKQINGVDVSVLTNRALRAGRGSSRATRFDKLVETGYVKEPVVLWRSAILPKELVDSLQKGSTFIDKGFQSTGVREKEAIFYAEQRFRDTRMEDIPVIFRMKVNKGVGAVDVGYGETILQRKTKMSVTGVKSGPKIEIDYDTNAKKPVFGPNYVYVDVEVDKA